MAKSNSNIQTGDVVIADGEPLNLRNRQLAALLAWLLPGLGHYYQGRHFKARIYFASIMICLVLGLVVSGGRCVYASWNGVEKRWQYLLQSGNALPAVPAAIQAWRKSGNKAPFFEGWFFEQGQPAPFAAPRDTGQLDKWHYDTASGFELGTLYVMIAGLLNVLAIYDAYSGPLPPPHHAKKKKGEDEKAENPV
jgi:hypothetical protein